LTFAVVMNRERRFNRKELGLEYRTTDLGDWISLKCWKIAAKGDRVPDWRKMKVMDLLDESWLKVY